MTLVAICPKCSEVRYRSVRDYRPGEPIAPEDFVPVGDAPAPQRDALMACFGCGTTLVFRREPVSGASPPKSAALPTPSRDNGAAPGALITPIFEVREGESVISIRELVDGRYVIQTSHRLLLIDFMHLLTREMPS